MNAVIAIALSFDFFKVKISTNFKKNDTKILCPTSTLSSFMKLEQFVLAKGNISQEKIFLKTYAFRIKSGVCKWSIEYKFHN